MDKLVSISVSINHLYHFTPLFANHIKIKLQIKNQYISLSKFTLSPKFVLMRNCTFKESYEIPRLERGTSANEDTDLRSGWTPSRVLARTLSPEGGGH